MLRPPSPSAVTLVVMLGFLLGGLRASPARAESALRLPFPPHFGSVRASTYDPAGRRVGPAELEIARLPDGRVQIRLESGIAHGERSVVTALLEPTPDRGALRPLLEESRSFDARGLALGVLRIDHAGRRASCEPGPARPGSGGSLVLPAHDRVANVPLNLLFRPLVRGEAEEVDFRIFVCRGGPRLLDARARVVRGHDGKASRGSASSPPLIEVRYTLSLGAMMSRLMRPFLPKFSFWFDGADSGRWIAHRMPLYAKGPTVYVVRSGFTPEALAAGR